MVPQTQAFKVTPFDVPHSGAGGLVVVETVTCPECAAVHVPVDVGNRVGIIPDKRHGQVLLSVSRCPNCLMHYALYRDERNNVVWWEPHTARPEVPEGVPKPILDDYIEGQRALANSLHKAAAAMFRRAVQGASIDKGAPDRPLRDQIDWLADNNRITRDMKDWAHELRLFGNAGAHPGKDLLDTVTEAEAQDAFVFAKSFLEYLYVMPHRVASRRGRAQPTVA